MLYCEKASPLKKGREGMGKGKGKGKGRGRGRGGEGEAGGEGEGENLSSHNLLSRLQVPSFRMKGIKPVVVRVGLKELSPTRGVIP